MNERVCFQKAYRNLGDRGEEIRGDRLKSFEVVSKGSDTEGTNVAQDWESLLNLIKDRGWENISGDEKMTPTTKRKKAWMEIMVKIQERR